MVRATVTAWILGHVDRRTARGATRAILAHTLGVTTADLQISRRCALCDHPTHGKPFVEGATGLSFSASYSGPLALLAVAQDATVGADIEVLRTRRYLDRLAQRVLAPAELAQWEVLPDERRLEGFLQAWTAKEAYLKAIGKGLTVRFHDVPVRPPGWTIAPVAVTGGIAYVAVDGEADLRTRTWHSPRVSASGGTAS
jgi:4'-phosphopantetheinyl transferase